jgi:hypothetical protein
VRNAPGHDRLQSQDAKTISLILRGMRNGNLAEQNRLIDPRGINTAEAASATPRPPKKSRYKSAY